MKDYSHLNTKRLTPAPVPRKRRNSSIWKVLAGSVTLIMILSGAIVARLALAQRNLQFSEVKTNYIYSIEEKKHEITELRNQKEALCTWKHVKKQMEKYQLGMIKLDSNKVRYLTRCSIDEYKTGSGRSLVDDGTSSGQSSEIAMLSQDSPY